MARAVPQLPAPMMARFFTARFRMSAEVEAVFRAGVQALDVLAMPVDYEGAGDQRSDEHRQLRMLHDPDGQREGGRGADGAERNVAAPGHHDQEDNQDAHERERRQAQERADEAGHGLAAFEPEEHGKGVASHHGERGERHPDRLCARQASGDPHRGIAFGDIEQQRGDAGGAAGGAQHVGRADIAAAGSAHVGAGGQADQEIAERDGAKQVGDEQSEKRGHVWVSGNSASLVYTEPVGFNWLR